MHYMHVQTMALKYIFIRKLSDVKRKISIVIFPTISPCFGTITSKNGIAVLTEGMSFYLYE